MVPLYQSLPILSQTVVAIWNHLAITSTVAALTLTRPWSANWAKPVKPTVATMIPKTIPIKNCILYPKHPSGGTMPNPHFHFQEPPVSNGLLSSVCAPDATPAPAAAHLAVWFTSRHSIQQFTHRPLERIYHLGILLFRWCHYTRTNRSCQATLVAILGSLLLRRMRQILLLLRGSHRTHMSTWKRIRSILKNTVAALWSCRTGTLAKLRVLLLHSYQLLFVSFKWLYYTRTSGNVKQPKLRNGINTRRNRENMIHPYQSPQRPWPNRGHHPWIHRRILPGARCNLPHRCRHQPEILHSHGNPHYRPNGPFPSEHSGAGRRRIPGSPRGKRHPASGRILGEHHIRRVSFSYLVSFRWCHCIMEWHGCQATKVAIWIFHA